MLEEELVIGLKILAKIHSGEIEITCSNCDDDQKIRLKCEKVINGSPEYSYNDIIFTDDDLGDFCTCPLKWLSRPIYEFWDEYLYYQTFVGTAPKYGKHNQRFWEAAKIYKNEYDSSSSKMMKKPKSSNSDNELQKLRNNFRKKPKG